MSLLLLGKTRSAKPDGVGCKCRTTEGKSSAQEAGWKNRRAGEESFYLQVIPEELQGTSLY